MLLLKLYSRDCNNVIRVESTADAGYARDCFDGSDREWRDVLSESTGEFFIVSTGLAGLFMADNVDVFGDKETALEYARDTKTEWDDSDADSDALESES